MRRLRVGIRRRTPRPRQLRGTMLHRWFGDRIFDPRLWNPTPHEVAAGLALGVFVALTPTMSVQLIVSAVAAYLLRVNLPVTLLACWITNPATAVPIYAFELKVGHWLLESGLPPGPADAESGMKGFVAATKTIWVGSLAVGIPTALAVYVAARLAWTKILYVFPAGRPASRDWRALRRAHLERMKEVEEEARREARTADVGAEPPAPPAGDPR